MSAQIQAGGYFALAVLLMVLGLIAMFALLYRRTPQGKVLVRTGLGGTKVSFGGILCIPGFQHLEAVDITATKLELRHFGESALQTKDNVLMHAQVGIILRVPPTEDDVLRVVEEHGAKKPSDAEWVDDMFRDRFEEALTTSLRQFTWQEIEESFEPLKSEFKSRVGTDLLGFVMEDVSFGHLAKPVEAADLENQPDMPQVSKN